MSLAGQVASLHLAVTSSEHVQRGHGEAWFYIAGSRHEVTTMTGYLVA